VAVAAVLNAEHCEIYTDVDGVYTADPRLVPQARKIHRISYDVMLEMAASGAQILHSRAVEFGKKFDVPIHVRSSLTDVAGTMIMQENKQDRMDVTHLEEIAVQGVTLKRDLALVALIGVPNRPGVAAAIFKAVADATILVDDIVQNIHDDGKEADIGFSIQANDVAHARQICESLADSIGISAVEVDEDVCKVAAIGAGMRSYAGIAATMFQALADAKINIENISTSEIVISCMVRRQDGAKALQVVHDAFGLHQDSDAAPSG